MLADHWSQSKSRRIIPETEFRVDQSGILDRILLERATVGTHIAITDPESIVTLTSDGRAGAQNGSSVRVMSRAGRVSRGARHQKPQTGAHDMPQLPADGGVGGSGHG